ncbi:MAG: aspartate aminotransferase family protein [Bacteroidia bacterium]|jgi:acetylornithine/succinyldiaminopimelate/putrescine aminotransferase|nr:aspartate aminotransferase family protein [Bacteroidia bacterium]
MPHLSNRELFLLHQAQTTKFPLLLEFVRANGIYLYDVNNKPYIDFISGISVSNLGHGNKSVIEAIKSQAESYMHQMVYGEYIQSPQIKLAKALTDVLPPSLNSVYFVNSGTEATEGALKLAKRVTGNSKIFAFKQAYHGSTHGALSLNSNEYFKQAFRPLLPDIGFLDYEDESSLLQIDKQTACVFVEIVRSETGYIPVSKNFLHQLQKRCNDTCTLLVVDEIQTGFGRTGSLFAFEQAGIVPDILLLGKALGAGLPMGAFIASNSLMSTLAYDPILGHITTFGGNPVVCAAALAGFNELRNGSIIEQVVAKENQIRNYFKQAGLSELSGKGLMLAYPFPDFTTCKTCIDACIEDGLLTDWFLFADNCMRIAPPLIITPEEIEKACSIIIKNIKKVSCD